MKGIRINEGGSGKGGEGLGEGGRKGGGEREEDQLTTAASQRYYDCEWKIYKVVYI